MSGKSKREVARTSKASDGSTWSRPHRHAWRAPYNPDAPIVLTRRESLQILEMLEKPPQRSAKFLEAQAGYRQSQISNLIDTLVQGASVEECADTGLLVGKIPGMPRAHYQGGTS